MKLLIITLEQKTTNKVCQVKSNTALDSVDRLRQVLPELVDNW